MSELTHSATARPARQAVFAGFVLIASVTAFVILYYIAVRTHGGQRLDASAVRLRHVLRRSQYSLAARMHDWVSIASVAFLGGAIVLVAFVRRRPRAAIAAGVMMFGSMVTTEVIKHTSPRPFRGVVDSLGAHNTFPSGHTTVAVALAVGAIVVASAASRRRVAPLAALFAAGVGCSLVVTASHRPSDIIGAALVVLGWAAAVRIVMPRSHRRASADLDDEPSGAWMTISGFLLLIIGFAAAGLIIIAVHFGRLPHMPIGRSFVASACAMTGSVFIVIAAATRLQRD